MKDFLSPSSKGKRRSQLGKYSPVGCFSLLYTGLNSPGKALQLDFAGSIIGLFSAQTKEHHRWPSILGEKLCLQNSQKGKTLAVRTLQRITVAMGTTKEPWSASWSCLPLVGWEKRQLPRSCFHQLQIGPFFMEAGRAML